MKKYAKVISLFIVICMVVTVFTACENENKTNNGNYETGDIGDTGGLKLPIDDKNTQLEILVTTSETGLEDSVVFKELSARTGLDIKVLEVTPSVINQKVSTLMATGDKYPDIMYGGSSWQQTNEFGVQGAFEEIVQHKDELPNFKRIFFDEAEKYKTVGAFSNMYASDGGLYMFPQYDLTRTINHGMLYRKDIFDKHNIKLWNDEESFYNTLKKLKELYPDSVPFVTKNGIGVISDLLTFYGMRTCEYYDNENGVWKYGATEPEMKELLDFLKKLIDENLMDEEFLTTTQQAWTQKMTQSSKSFVTYDWIGRMSQFEEQTKDVVEGYELKYGPAISAIQKFPGPGMVSGGPRVKAGKNSMLALKLLDYLMSPSGAELMMLGIEGVTYNFNEDGKAVYVGFEDRIPTTTELCGAFGLFPQGAYVRGDKRSAQFQFTEAEQFAQEFPEKYGNGFWPADPKLSFTSKETDELNTVLVVIDRYYQEFAAKYILNPDSGDKEWEEWLKKADKYGVNKAKEILNTAQKRYDEMIKNSENGKI